MANFCAFGLKTNRNWNLLRKFWNLHIQISMENWLFILFLSHRPGPLSFYTALENNTIFLQQFFRFRGGGEASPLPPPAGAPVLYFGKYWPKIMKNPDFYRWWGICLSESSRKIKTRKHPNNLVFANGSGFISPLKIVNRINCGAGAEASQMVTKFKL